MLAFIIAEDGMSADIAIGHEQLQSLRRGVSSYHFRRISAIYSADLAIAARRRIRRLAII